MKAFHNDPAVRQKYLDRVAQHAALDEIVQGHYWEDGKGCAVGCTVHKRDGQNPHEAFETDLGIPKGVALLEDRIFEGLPNEKAKEFPLRFLSAIPLGADLSMVTAKFVIWLLVDPVDGVIRYAGDGINNTALADRIRKSIQDTAALYVRRTEGDEPSASAWSAAESAAWSAARSAARSAAWSAAYVVMSEKLLQLLTDAPVPVEA